MLKALISASVLVLVLAGCSPTSAAPTFRATTPKPSASAPGASTAPTVPSPTLAATCDQLLPSAQVAGMFAAPVTPRVDETSGPSTFVDVAARQAGGTRCTWGGTGRTDNGYDDGMVLSVIPSGSADYATFASQLVGTDGLIAQSAGDQSLASCEGSGGSNICDAQLLVGQYWLSVDYHTVSGVPSGSSAGQLLAAAMTRLASVAASSGSPRPAFDPPASAWSGSALCADDALGRTQTAFGVPGMGRQDNSYEPPYDAASIALGRVDERQCSWALPAGSPQTRGVAGVVISLVPGGGWALPLQLDSPPTSYYYGAQKPTTITGATNAMLTCNSIDCEAIMSVDSTWIQVEVDGGGADPSAVPGQIAALLAATPRT